MILNPTKTPGYDLITGRVFKELPLGRIRLITMIFDAILTQGYFPPQWKVVQIILVQKPGKYPTDVKSHRPVNVM